MILSDNARGVLFMCVAMAAFTGNDALMKSVTQSLPLMQAIAIRGAISAVLLLALARALGQWRIALPRADRGRMALRTFAELASTLTFLSALMHMPLANLSAIMQSLPLAVTLAAALFLAEPVGWRRMLAIGTGFLGVLLIIRPGAEGFDIWSVVGVLSVLFVVVRDLSTRRFSTSLPSVTIALLTSVAVMAMGIVGMGVGALQGQGWVAPSAGELAQLAGAAIMVVLGYLFIVKTMRSGDVSIVAPFRYTSLIWAILLGWLVFGTLPDALTWAGAGLIVASGLFTLWREARLNRVRR
ncbi:MAG: DMT family transporter [Paracoccaceae bacterium]|nr:MAG: DMT family transporter [Paracoccaceae bacterium]